MTAAPTRAEDVSLSRRVGAFALLMVFEFFYGWSWNTVDVLRPQIRASLSLDLSGIAWSYTAQAIGALIGAVVLATVADRYGRRRVLYVIVTGIAVMGWAGVHVTSFPQLLAQRFLLGCFLGGIFPVLIALYMGLFPGDIRGKLASLGQGTYNASVIALGASLGWVAPEDWRGLLWVAAVPLLLFVPLIGFMIPDDRKVRAWGDTEETPPTAAALPIVELFRPDLIRLTGLLFLLVGCNFFGYQAFAGWVSTYLADDMGFDAPTVGSIIAWQFSGALIGGFFWGWFSDRYGRRPCAIGFAFGAALILIYIHLFSDADALRYIGFAWGFMITASVAWAPWMSVLFPVHLRSTAMSIFNWGRIISMTAPLITGWVAKNYGMPAAMSLGAIGFAAGAVVWWLLPETRRATVTVPAPAGVPA